MAVVTIPWGPDLGAVLLVAGAMLVIGTVELIDRWAKKRKARRGR